MPYLAAAHSAVPTADAKLTDWLVAVGGLGAFIATAVLAFVAWRQMGKLDAQVQAARDQVDAMKETSAAELSAVRDQIEASIEQNRAVREAARAQLQHVVLAHATQIVEGPDEEYSIREDQLAIAYYVANEGSGIALNIRHGVKIEGQTYEYGDGLQIRVLGPGESQPIRDPVSSQLIWRVPMFIVRPREELSLIGSVSYWASFQSVFGERFETVNPRRPNVPFMFRRVDDTNSATHS
jgi:hypothetical protein